MEDKLELRDIAGYLPHELKCQVMGEFIDDSIDDPIPKTYTIDGSFSDSNKERMIQIIDNEDDCCECYICDCFPLLRPVSDLKKEININGKTFIPYEELGENAVSEYWGQGINGHGISPTAHFHLILLLFEWHFDVFGLIERGLAIKK